MHSNYVLCNCCLFLEQCMTSRKGPWHIPQIQGWKKGFGCVDGILRNPPTPMRVAKKWVFQDLLYCTNSPPWRINIKCSSRRVLPKRLVIQFQFFGCLWDYVHCTVRHSHRQNNTNKQRLGSGSGTFYKCTERPAKKSVISPHTKRGPKMCLRWGLNWI